MRHKRDSIYVIIYPNILMMGDLMGGLESKKLLIVRILEILQNYSDHEHPLTHCDIINYLKQNYNSECERKAIGRNISFLKEAGHSIETTKRGVYLDNRLFETSELRLLIDSVLASRHINKSYSKQLINKLSSLGGYHFKKRIRNIKVSEWGKSNNVEFFLNIEVIDEAIEKGRQISFMYNYYSIDKKMHPKRRDEYIINPYQMMLHNQRYYLIGNMDKYDNLTYYRIDRITDIKMLTTPAKSVKSLPEHYNGLDLAKIYCDSPYMFTGKIDNITMLLNKNYISDIIDWFGNSVIISKVDDDTVKINVNANSTAVRYWALQYGTNVEIIEPDYLREYIIEDIKSMSSRYQISNKDNTD